MRNYRGQRVDTKKWVYGWYVFDRLQDMHHIFDDSVKGAWRFEVIFETVGQGRGIDDKDNEIYDGDTISFLPKDGSSENIQQVAVVYYCEKREMTCVKSKAWDCPLFNCKDIEVIGNIHNK